MKRNERKTHGNQDQLPPHAMEAERAVLACCLLDAECLPEVLLKVTSGAFYDLRHARLFGAMEGLHKEGRPVDTVAVHQRLADQGELEEVGGAVFLAEVARAMGSAANVEYYAEIVREKWLLRQTVRAATETVQAAMDDGNQAGLVIERWLARAMELGAAQAGGGDARIGERYPEIQRRIEEMSRGRPQLLGFATGFRYLDNMLCGLIPGDYYVLSARPSVGKTALAMQIAVSLAKTGVGVGFFSLEMSARALAERVVFGESGGSLQKYRNGFLPETDVQRVMAKMEELKDLSIWIDDTPGMNMQQLGIRARRMQQRRGIKVFMIDYLQLLDGEPGSENRNYELGRISKRIKALGKELNCPFLVLAQMNRDYEKDPTRKPQMSDLRDSGQVEADADVVMFLYDVLIKKHEKEDLECPAMQWLKHQPAVEGKWWKSYRRINLLVAKQRNGPTGDVELVYRKPVLRFVDAYVKDKEEEAPAPASAPAASGGMVERIMRARTVKEMGEVMAEAAVAAEFAGLSGARQAAVQALIEERTRELSGKGPGPVPAAEILATFPKGPGGQKELL